MVTVAESKERVKIPEGVTLDVTSSGKVTVKGPKGTLERNFRAPRVSIGLEEGALVVRSLYPRRREKAAVGAVASHIRNMVEGAAKGYTYRMKVVFAHFPIKAVVKDTELEIQNFLGERAARHATILGGVAVEVKGDQVTVTGTDLERVSQTAANIERATKIRNRDIRVFQDGIYITEKAA